MIFEIEKIFEKFSDKKAYSVNGEEYSYSELLKRAKEISALLEGKNSPVAVLGNRSFETMAAIIACLLLKRAYVPVDLSLPEERKEKIVLISNASDLIDCSGEKAKIKPIKTEENLSKNETAYMIFTSGTTGEPKGVPISYKNLENFINWITAVEPLCEYEHASVLNHASFSFDLSTAAIYYAFAGGHTLVQLENTKDFESVFSVIEKSRTDVLVATPTFIRLCLLNKDFEKGKFPFIKCIYFCGETLQKSLAEAVFKRFPEIRIINAYGPTEATSAVCAYEITKEMLECEKILPVGKLSSAATEIEIENGEIVLKGKSVFGGYLGIKSENVFFENGRNCYRTGDLGFIREGKLFCTGRKDSQIKYKGYRIELSEIESVISSIEGTENCAVIAKRNPEGEVRLLKAFVSGKVEETEIRKKLSEKLPEYMVPKSIKILETIPLNKNGKTDRKVLEEL